MVRKGGAVTESNFPPKDTPKNKYVTFSIFCVHGIQVVECCQRRIEQELEKAD